MGEFISKSIEIPGYTGGGLVVKAGSTFRVIDLEGSQIGDLFVLSATDVSEFLSPSWTKNVIFKMVPRPGDELYSNRSRAMMTMIDDTSPGIHDMQFAPCDQSFYEMYGAGDAHPNCKDNFYRVMRNLEIECGAHPDPFNLFQNSPPNPDGDFTALQSVSRAGDYVEFRAEMDLVVVVTACSADITFDGVCPIGNKSTSLRIEVFG